MRDLSPSIRSLILELRDSGMSRQEILFVFMLAYKTGTVLDTTVQDYKSVKVLIDQFLNAHEGKGADDDLAKANSIRST